MLGVFERGLDIHPFAIGGLKAQLHDRAVGNDVELPFFEVGNFVLGLADDQLDDGLIHPSGLGQQLVALRVQYLAGFIVYGGGDVDQFGLCL